MPKKPSVPPEAIIDILKKYKDVIVSKDEDIKPPSNSVWKDICIKEKIMMSAKALYTFVKTDKHNILSKLDLHKKYDLPLISESSCTSSKCSDNNSSCEQDTEHFQLVLLAEKWNQIKPKPAFYARSDRKHSFRRPYYVLKKGVWTDVINESLWQKSHFQCTWVFKRVVVQPNSPVCFIKIIGYCKECRGNVRLECLNEPVDGQDVVFETTVDIINSFEHTGKIKRNLAGERRDEMTKILCESKETPSSLRKLEASKTMIESQPEPSQLPKLSVLRTAKHQALMKKRLHSDPILAICKAKNDTTRQITIHDIGIDKFFVHYWSVYQMRTYRKYWMKGNSKLSIDATGSIVNRLNRVGNGKSGHIFLYVGVANVTSGDEGTIPIFQMLSERHSTSAITFWLNEWIRSGAPIPKRVVCDFSLALLGAVCRAFTGSSGLKDYMGNCFSLLVGKEKIHTPTCFVRVDVAHVMKVVSTWKELRGKSKRFREFYLRAIGLLINSYELSEVKDHLTAIVIVAVSETEGESKTTSKQLPCELGKIWLKDCFSKGFVDSNLLESLEIVLEEEPQDEDDYITVESQPDNISTWVNDLVNSAKKTASIDDGDRENLQYAPTIVDKIKHLCGTLPLWTGVMCNIFKARKARASSAEVESYFNNLKSRDFRGQLPMRVDDFLLRHVKLIEGSVLISAANLQTQKTYDTMRSNKVEINDKQTTSGQVDEWFQKHEYENENEKSESQYNSDEIGSNVTIKEVDFMEIKCENNDGAKEKSKLELPLFKTDTSMNEKKRIGSNSPTHTHSQEMLHVENWRGQAVPPKKRRTGFYLESNPDWALMNEGAYYKQVKIGLLRNGNCHDLKSVEISGSFYSLKNTCPFDSLVQSLATSYCDSEAYKNAISYAEEIPIFSLVKRIALGPADKNIYKTRADILRQIYTVNTMPGGLNVVECNSHITYVVQKCLLQVHSLEEVKTCSSPYCHVKKINKYCFLSANADVLSNKGVQYLKEALESELPLPSTKCLGILKDLEHVPDQFISDETSENNLCNGKITRHFQTGNQILIEIPDLLADGSSLLRGSEPALSLIPFSLELMQKILYLRAVIAFHGPLSVQSVGHYTAYCKRSDGYWEHFDDLATKVKKVSSDTKVPATFAFIYHIKKELKLYVASHTIIFISSSNKQC